jgi:lipopolysaccharide transport system ATP-binding protein
MLFNDRGVQVLNALDTNPMWRKPQKEGRYKSIAWIPGNLLNEGALIVTVALMDVLRYSFKPPKHAMVTEAVSFQVVDSGVGPSAKGDYAQTWLSAVYPLLKWTTERN